MAQFQYTAVNSQGKKLSGIIGAENEEQARKQLSTFGISLLSIQKTAETPTQSSTKEPGTSEELSKFEFEAFDRTGKKVLGTIPASSRYKAFKRLMEEYQFEVSYVVPIGASDEEKLKAKQEDLSVLKQEYEATHKTTDKRSTEEKQIGAEFEEKRKILLQKVDFILSKIKDLLTQFQGEMNPDSEKLIQGYIDKLLRIKNSTNLDYIQSTSEELLKKVQDQELFLHKEKATRDRDKFKLEAQKLMATLHSQPAKTAGLTQDIEEVQSHFTASKNPLLKALGLWLQSFLPTPEEKTLKEKIATLKHDIWTYRKIVWKAPASTKAEAKQSLQALLDERNRLEQELKTMKKSRKNGLKEDESPEPLLTEEIHHFLSWLLLFYLLAYFLSYYFMAKHLSDGNPLPGDFNLLLSGTLRHLLLSIFLWHILLQIRMDHLRYKPWANLLILPLGIVLNAGLVFNL